MPTAAKTDELKAVDSEAKKSTANELKIFKTRKEVKEKMSDEKKTPEKSTEKPNAETKPRRPRNRSPTKLLQRLLSPTRSSEAKIKTPTPKKPKTKSNAEAKTKSTSDVRDIQPPPTIEPDPEENASKVALKSDSYERTSRTLVMRRQPQKEQCDVKVVARKKRMSVDCSSKSRPNEFFYTDLIPRASVCGTFTLDRPRKLADEVVGSSPRSPGLVSLQTSTVGSLGTRSMSSHHLVAQHSTPLITTSASTLTLRATSPSTQQIVDLDVDNVLASLSNTPTASINSPTSGSTTSTLAKFPSTPSDSSPASNPTTSIAENKDKTPTADAQDAMVESVHAKTASLANKLSRSFFDLTHGSSDRLARWKSKLQQYGQQRQRSSEKEQMSSSKRMASLDGSVPGNDVIVDWRTETKTRRNPPQAAPRPLHTSRSATNALCHGLSLESSLPSQQSTNVATATLPKALHKSASVREVEIPSGHRNRQSSPSHAMEHRTLKQRENFVSGRRSPPDPAHMQSLHELVQSIEGLQQNTGTNKSSRNGSSTLSKTRGAMSQDNTADTNVDLPPPARITPYSGIKPQDNGIIRPIAFRPLAQNSGVKRASERHSNSPDGMLPTFYNKSNLTIEQHKQALKDHSRSIGNLNNLSAPRSRHPLHQPSTSSSSQLFAGKSIGSLPTTNDENDYDTVPEYIDRNKCFDDQNRSETYSSINSYHTHHNRTHSQNAPSVRNPSTYFTSLNGGGSTTTSSQFTSSSASSTGSTNSPPSNGLKKSISGSQQNLPRQSNGQHITPSPDSGIIDYESLIRDKENELHSVRQAMETNESVLIRVYNEKERQYREQVADLKQKLMNAQQAENALRKQLRQSDDHRGQLQKSVQSLNDEKLSMQRQCVKIERELQQLRSRLDEQRPCDSCRRNQTQQSQSIYENNGQSMGKPVPAPRLLNKEPSADRELRSELDELKSEIGALRNQLHQQVQIFAEERRRWETDRNSATHMSDSTQLNNNLPGIKPSAFAQHRSLSEKRPMLSVDRLI
ncbi:hypothetical protein M3Y95_00465500 [Aphelenchoides besseyi]|nr:hypothetical protein M3Y95_00465500 [Aphelenchoides besseyi]